MFEIFHIFVDFLHLLRNVDVLRALWEANFAAHTVVGLPQTWYRAIVSDEECSAVLLIVVGLSAVGKSAFVDAFIVVSKYGGDVEAIGAWHAVLAVSATDFGELGDDVGSAA